MMTLEELKNDYDWRYAFGEAFGGQFGEGPVDDVDTIYATDDGENDGPEWIGLFRMKTPNDKGQVYVKVTAGCDYTGWD